MKNEEKLKVIFDFQRFEQNQRLAQLINEAESDAVELSDDALLLVSAAGVRDPITEQILEL